MRRGSMFLLGVALMGVTVDLSHAQEVECGTVSSGAAMDAGADTIFNMGQVMVGLSSNDTQTMHAGVIPCLGEGGGGPFTIMWTGDGDATSWHDPANWDLNRVPGPGDDVGIPDVAPTTVVVYSSGETSINSLTCDEEAFDLTGGTLSIDDVSVIDADFTLTTGTLTGAGDLSVAGSMTWNSGTMSGAGTTIIEALATLSMGGSIRFLERTLDNHGTADWTAGQWRFIDGTFNNLSDGTFNASANQTTSYSSGTSAFNNQGQFNHTGTATTTFTYGVVFNNDGTVSVNDGTLNLGSGGTHTGDFDGVGTLEFGGGTHTLELASNVTTSDVIFSGNGTTDIHGGYDLIGSSTTVSGGGIHTFYPDATVGNAGDTLTITGGTVDFSSGEPINVTTYTQSVGTLTGSDSVSVAGSATWNGGAMSGAGTTIIEAGATLSMGGSIRFLERSLDNHGAADWTTGQWRFIDGTFNNLSDGTFNASANRTTSYSSGTSAFNNEGQFNHAGTATTTFTYGVVFNNDGAVSVNDGTLNLGSGGTHTGDFDGVGTLEFAGGTHALGEFSSVTGAGTVRFGPASTMVNIAGTYDISGITDITGGTINFNTDAITNLASLSAGTLQGTGNFTVTGSMSWNGGSMSGEGTTIIEALATLSMGGSIRFLERTLDNHGTVDWTTGQWRFIDGTFNNLSGGTFNASANADTSYSSGTSAFNNEGQFNHSGTATTTFRYGVVFNNDGTVEVQSGVLSFSADYTQMAGATILNGGDIVKTGTPLDIQGGVLTGDGTVFGDVINSDGQVAPGLSPGILAIDGDYAQIVTPNTAGVLDIELAGLAQGSEYDLLTVSGTATLDGELQIALIGGFVPQAGQEFVILTAGSVTGTFSAVTGLGEYSVAYNPSNVTITTVWPPGDLNCDGVLDAFDIDPFVLALTDPDGYAAAYPDCDIMLADINGDGTIDAFDIDPFVELLVGG